MTAQVVDMVSAAAHAFFPKNYKVFVGAHNDEIVIKVMLPWDAATMIAGCAVIYAIEIEQGYFPVQTIARKLINLQESFWQEIMNHESREA